MDNFIDVLRDAVNEKLDTLSETQLLWLVRRMVPDYNDEYDSYDVLVSEIEPRKLADALRIDVDGLRDEYDAEQEKLALEWHNGRVSLNRWYERVAL